MSVLVLDLMGERDEITNNIILELVQDTGARLVRLRGAQLAEGEAVLGIEPYRVVVVVLHGDERGHWVDLDAGLEGMLPAHPNWELEDRLGGPTTQAEILFGRATVIMQLLGHNPVPYVVVYLACHALVADTLVAGMADTNCLGAVASMEELHGTDVPFLSRIVNAVRGSLERGEENADQLGRLVSGMVREHGGHPQFIYSDVPRNIEE